MHVCSEKATRQSGRQWPITPDKGRRIIRVIPCHVACVHAGGCGAGGGIPAVAYHIALWPPSDGSDGRCAAVVRRPLS